MYLDINPENELDIEKMFSAYIKRVVFWSRQKYDKSYNTRLQREELTQNCEYDDIVSDSLHNLEDQFQIEEFINVDSAHIENIFTDEKMYSTVKNLKPKQKFVLYLLYYQNRSEQETADILSISRQRVNKIKNEALKKIMYMYLSK
jgi:RNA polymerase sigma factor (sigma-70 family)